jgi:hypothetical protein
MHGSVNIKSSFTFTSCERSDGKMNMCMRKCDESGKIQTNLELCSKYPCYYFLYIFGIYGHLLQAQV